MEAGRARNRARTACSNAPPRAPCGRSAPQASQRVAAARCETKAMLRQREQPRYGTRALRTPAPAGGNLTFPDPRPCDAGHPCRHPSLLDAGGIGLGELSGHPFAVALERFERVRFVDVDDR